MNGLEEQMNGYGDQINRCNGQMKEWDE
jgi:hypothetical protein